MEHPVANFHDELGGRDELPYRIAKKPGLYWGRALPGELRRYSGFIFC
jgi:hypothetical protein